ncbi:MAG: inositol 2-dehydrogenase [Acidobacteria bacterium]|nr:MAG: inositol 2-dehydrogenase [Acidobacteriota bacterium]
MTDKLNFALIGAGRIGRVHAQTVAQRIPHAHLSLVVDTDLEAARRLAGLYAVPRAVSDYAEALADPDVDAVLICTSTNTHASIVQYAARAGKHIFCEKPISQSLAEIDETLTVVEKAGVKFQVGFNRRFDANFSRVRRAIESGEIGEPSLLHIISRDPAPPSIDYVRSSGGMFLDMTIHDFDMARYLIGSDVEEIFTMAGVRVDPAIGDAGDVDTAIIMLRFANGVIGSIDNSRRAAYGYDQRVEVLGSKGAIATLNNYPNQAIVSDAESVRRDLPLNFFMDRYTDSFIAEVSVFVDAILRDAPVPVSGNDARLPVVMALAAAQSHREGRPVRLSEITVAA